MKIIDLFENIDNLIRFDGLDDLSSAVINDVYKQLEQFKSSTIYIETGFSNVSCSAYINIQIYDDNDQLEEELKIRVSDHQDKYGSDITYFINSIYKPVYQGFKWTDEDSDEYEIFFTCDDDDDDLEFSHFIVDKDDFKNMVNEIVLDIKNRLSLLS